MATAANTAFITTLYSTTLLRSGSAGDINIWATALDSGQFTQAQAVTAFETSPEALASVDPVIRLYEVAFNRTPDTAGLTNWAAALSNKTATQAQMASSLVSSAEFAAGYGAAGSNTAFVTLLYQNVLGRVPDSAGLAGWVNALTAGTLTSAQVLLGFTNSTEYVNNSTIPINTWLSAANAAAQTGATSPYPAVIAGIVPTTAPPSTTPPVTTPPASTGTTFTLTTAIDNFAGGSGNDTFLAGFSNGGTNTLTVGDILAGNGGTDTLLISPTIPNTAITLDDTYWARMSGIQNVTFATTGAGAQTLTSGTNFNAAFAAGVTLTMTTTGGAINVVLGTFTGTETIATTSTDGAQTITTGSGPATVTASSGAGALVILGANLATVSATTTGAGAQTIGNSGTNAVTITATDSSGAQTITTGNGNSTITDTTASGLVTITVGNGNNTIDVSGSAAGAVEHITVGSGSNIVTLNAAHTAIETLTFSAANGGSANSFTTVANIHAADTITFAVAALNNTVTSQAATVGSVSAGIAAATLTSGYNIFHDAANTYVYEYTGASATSELVALVGNGHTITGLGGIATLMA